MQRLSIVIICKNEADVIAETLTSFSGLTDDIIVFDNDSTDGTQEIVRKTKARLFEGGWEGFGKTKNKANALAKYDWILSLDADEAIENVLKQNLVQLNLTDDRIVYEFRFKNFLANKWLRFGEWGRDKHLRLFNRKWVRWNDAAVHESLIIPEGVAILSLKGYVLHRTAGTIKEYEEKMKRYAMLNAEKYLKQGKKNSAIQMLFSPAFSFIKNYFFKLGFLDGVVGYQCAKINARYTFLKYKQLQKFNEDTDKK